MAEAEIPFYLRNTFVPVKPTTIIPEVTTEYDFSYIQDVNPSGGGLWANIADSVDNGINVVKDDFKSVGDSVKSGLTGILDEAKSSVLIAVALGLVIVVVVAKTGILKQVAGVAK